MIEEYILCILIALILLLVILLLHTYRMSASHARRLFEVWREREVETIRLEIKRDAEDLIRREVDLRTREWMEREEEGIRKDAVRRSRDVIAGKVTEHLIPFFPDFPWNPSDARFLGSPVDFIVFDGLSEGEVREVVMVEVKSGRTRTLSPREKAVERCIQRGKVSFRLLHPADFNTR